MPNCNTSPSLGGQRGTMKLFVMSMVMVALTLGARAVKHVWAK
jgi:hypothetical protein